MINVSSPDESAYQLFVGIDIAAKTARVSICLSSMEEQHSFNMQQTPSGMADLHQRLLAAYPQPAQIHIVMENTGVYWMRLAEYLHAQGYAVSVISPYQSHHFAQALLQHAKTDALDALTIAQLAIKLQPKLWKPPAPIYAELYQRLMQRESLVQIRRRCKNRRHSASYRPVQVEPVQERLLALLMLTDAQIAAIDKELLPALRQDAEWLATANLLLTIPCLGLVTTCWLLVMTQNFTLCESPEQLVAYAGLAPYTRQSGTSLNSYRHVGRHGNRRLRRAMYMSAMSAIRHNSPIQVFYRRLVARGKNGKVALVAAARKIIRIVWAVATSRQPFNPNRLPAMPITPLILLPAELPSEAETSQPEQLDLPESTRPIEET